MALDDAPAAPARTNAAAPPRWSGPDGRVAALTGVLVVLAGVAQALVLVPSAPAVGPRDVVAVCLLALVSAATEGLSVPVRVRRGAHSVSLSEIPLVLGLVATGPLALLVARLVGGGAGLLFSRRQRGVKLAFN